jgi:dTDP-4-amino-4,6-dideoxygalactose transaminase
MIDLQAQYRGLKAELDAALQRVVDSARFVGGGDCGAFEEEFAAYCGVRHAVGVGNGTDALTIVLRALGIRSGDDVVTVANTFIATGEAILLNGARPVFVDVEESSYTLDPGKLERAITPRTRAILPVHLYGHPADMEPILEVARRHGVPVVEDAAQAHGARIGGRRVGSFGTAACFSFYPGKNLGAWGDAGMIVTDDAELAARVRQIANHGGGASKYDNVVVGTNSRLDTLQAALLRVKLRHLDDWNRARRARAADYSAALRGLPGVALPAERPGCTSAWHLFSIRVANRDGLAAHLGANGIATSFHYTKPIHLQPALATLGGRAGDLPVSERLCREVMQVPLFPEMSGEQVSRVADAIRSFCPSALARA